MYNSAGSVTGPVYGVTGSTLLQPTSPPANPKSTIRPRPGVLRWGWGSHRGADGRTTVRYRANPTYPVEFPYQLAPVRAQTCAPKQEVTPLSARTHDAGSPCPSM